jgi:hypothetical protein
MIPIGLFLLGRQIASEPISRITSVQIHYKRVGDGNSAIATVTERTIKGHTFKQDFQLDTYPGGAGNTKPIILDHGLVAIFTRHEMSRFNIIVGLTVANVEVKVDEDYNEKLFDAIPAKVRIKANLIPNNAQIIRVSKGIVTINFENRDDKDGVRATFRIKNGKWTCLSAKYWRDPNWDGIRRF